MPDAAADLKHRQRNHWNAVAGGWEKWHEWTERNFRPLTLWLRSAGWNGATRMLDVACGAGYPSLAAAEDLQSTGTVAAIDMSPGMLAVAERRARARGLDNITFHEMDADDIHFDAGSFDVVTNAYGLMFSPELDRVVAEARRVLRPGGRFAVVTWDAASESPFFGVITAIAAPLIGLAPPAAGQPGPFRLCTAASIEELLEGAGFREIEVTRFAMTLECASAAEYCEQFGDVAWKARIAALSPADRERFVNSVAEATQPYQRDGALHLLASSWCASARV